LIGDYFFTITNIAMKKSKISIKSLQVKSFITSLESKTDAIKGGCTVTCKISDRNSDCC